MQPRIIRWQLKTAPGVGSAVTSEGLRALYSEKGMCIMIAIFTNNDQTLIVGLDTNGDLIDKDGIISGPDPVVNLSLYSRVDFDPTEGLVINIMTHAGVVNNGATRIIK